jgi:hypothetical protein
MVSESFRQTLVSQKSLLEKEDVIRRVFAQIASQRGVEIPKELIDFMRLLVNQSLDYRQDEWASYPPETVRLRIQIVLGDILRGTRVYSPPSEKPILSVVSVLENIKNRWCDIFPVC